MKIRTLILLLIFGLIGCQRPESQTSSKIEIVAPGSIAMEAMPAGVKQCFAVNVTGDGIITTPNSCGPVRGIMAGFVEANSRLLLEVPKGASRTIELFMFLQTLGAPCPSFSSAIDPTYLFKVASAVNVDMSEDVAEVTLTAVFPGLASNLRNTMSLAGSCTGLAGDLPGSTALFIGTSAGIGVGGTNGGKMKVRVGGIGINSNSNVLQSPTGRKIYVR